MADVQPDATETTAEAPTPTAAAAPPPAVETAPAEVAVSPEEPAAAAASSVADAAQALVAEVASPGPELESTTLVPAISSEAPASEGLASEGLASEGGGEWELLLNQVKAWLGEGKLQAFWAQARNPLTLILAAAALLVVLRVYAALLSALDSLPLIPGLLELVGVVWAVRFGVPKLLQRSQREALFSSIRQRWESFRGRS